eukprot:GEMP01037472.1.p1 GENE.GEMP01037472.1~~GEMP01037472.1.p1  ORF type:complete len:378 (+),score=110.47 GEMP01037472.1:89-1222(+)
MTWGGNGNSWGGKSKHEWGAGAKDADWDAGNGWANDDAKGEWGGADDAQDPMTDNTTLLKKYISEVIHDENKWSSSTCDLLTFAVDNALKKPKAERHELQGNLVAELKAGIVKYKDMLESAQDEAQSLYERCDEDCDAAPTRLESLTAEIEEMETNKSDAEEKLQQEVDGMNSLKEEAENARDAVKTVQRKSKELNDKVTRTAHIYEREFLPMKKDCRAHGRLEKITQQLEKLGAEEVLLKCIDVSLKVSDRGELAMVAINMAEKVFMEKLDELRAEQSAISTTGLPKAERHLESSLKSMEEQREKVEECNKKLRDVQKSLDLKSKQKENCDLCISDPHTYRENLKSALEAAEATVAAFAECEEAVLYIEENAQDGE